MNDELKNIIEKIDNEIFVADQCIFFINSCNENINFINQNNFAELFTFQRENSITTLIIKTSNIYEKTKRNKNYSINHLLEYINKKTTVEIQRREDLFNLTEEYFNISFGEELKESSDKCITDYLIKNLNSLIPEKHNPKKNGLSNKLDKVFIHRDKARTHREIIDMSSMPELNINDVEELLQFAKKIMDLIGTTYFSKIYMTNNREYFLTFDAERIKTANERFIKRAENFTEDDLFIKETL